MDKPESVEITTEHLLAMLGRKEVDVQLARAQVQNAVQIIEGLKAQLAAAQTQTPKKAKG